MTLKFKYSHIPMIRPDGAVWIGPPVIGAATELLDDSGLLWAVCESLDGTRSRSDLIDHALRTRGAAGRDVAQEDVAEIIDFFVESGWVTETDAPLPPELSAREIDRYSRNALYFDAVDLRPETTGYELQAMLKAAKVAVLGLGGVGTAVAMSLTAAGVGRLHCVDHDKVELSNLNRQLLFTEQDIGHEKVRAGVRALRARNSDITVTGSSRRLDGVEAIAAEVAGCDAFVLCADQPYGVINYWANEAAYDAAIPWLTASYSGPKFSSVCFIPGRTPCVWCQLATHARRQEAGGGLAVPPPHALTHGGIQEVIAPSAQIAGHYLANDTIRLLVGLSVQTAGAELCRYLVDYEEHFYLRAEPQPDCPLRCTVPDRS